MNRIWSVNLEQSNQTLWELNTCREKKCFIWAFIPRWICAKSVLKPLQGLCHVQQNSPIKTLCDRLKRAEGKNLNTGNSLSSSNRFWSLQMQVSSLGRSTKLTEMRDIFFVTLRVVFHLFFTRTHVHSKDPYPNDSTSTRKVGQSNTVTNWGFVQSTCFVQQELSPDEKHRYR